jgi:hypothetical protein
VRSPHVHDTGTFPGKKDGEEVLDTKTEMTGAGF